MPLGPEHLAVALAAASIWSMGGVIFGIASLYPVLYYEGALESSSCGTAKPSTTWMLKPIFDAMCH